MSESKFITHLRFMIKQALKEMEKIEGVESLAHPPFLPWVLQQVFSLIIDCIKLNNIKHAIYWRKRDSRTIVKVFSHS